MTAVCLVFSVGNRVPGRDAKEGVGVVCSHRKVTPRKQGVEGACLSLPPVRVQGLTQFAGFVVDKISYTDKPLLSGIPPGW